MKGIYAAAIVAVAIVFLFLVARSARLRSRVAPSARSSAKRSDGAAARAAGGELVAVIAAAVAAASGMEPGSFRIASVSPSGGSSRECGFNTPVWGHIDRNNLGE